LASGNLSELSDKSAARVNLGLGSLSTKSTIDSADVTNETLMDEDISPSAGINPAKISGLTQSLGGKQNAITSTSVVNGGTFTTALQNGVELRPYSTDAGQTGELRFVELAASGSNYVGLKAPNAISNNLIWTLPSSDGSSGQVLKTDGAGTLSWITIPSSSVVSVAGRTGVVTLTTADVSEDASRLYFTQDRARSALSVSGPLTYIASTGVLGLDQASNTTSGFLSFGDYLAFSGKQSAGNYITALSGDGTATGPSGGGAAVLTLSNSGVAAGTYSKVIVDAKGRVTGGGSLLTTDIPNLDTSKVTTGTFGVERGGTGTGTLTSNGILYGNGLAAIGTTSAGNQYQVLRAGSGGTPAFGSINLDQSAAVTGVLPLSNGGTGAASAGEARTKLGLGTAATLDAGVMPNNVIQLDADGKIPALDGTKITGIVTTTGATFTGQLILPNDGLLVGTNQLVVESSKVGIGTNTPTEKLAVNGNIKAEGSIKVGDDNSACVPSKGGTIKYTGNSLFFCDGSSWQQFGAAIATLTLSPSTSQSMNVTNGTSPGSYITFTLTNTGSAASNTITTSLSNTTNFEFGTNNCANITLNIGGSCTIQVRPKASSNTTYSGTLTITANNNPTATLSGTASGFFSSCGTQRLSGTSASSGTGNAPDGYLCIGNSANQSPSSNFLVLYKSGSTLTVKGTQSKNGGYIQFNTNVTFSTNSDSPNLGCVATVPAAYRASSAICSSGPNCTSQGDTSFYYAIHSNSHDALVDDNGKTLSCSTGTETVWW
jgi:hypothetical protein